MALIFYGLSGDGRGHATRAQTVVEQLRQHHRVVVYAPLDAYELLGSLYKNTDVDVRHIPGIKMCFNAQRRVDYVRTGYRTARYLSGFPRLMRRIRKDMEREQPDLVISDFDPALPWAASGTGVPVVSLDHQHMMATSDLRQFPWRLRLYAATVSPTVRAFAGRPAAKIVSSFAFPPADPRHQNLHRVGVLLRKDVREARPETRAHLVAYFRRFAPPGMLEALAAGPMPVMVYGLGKQASRGALRFKAIDPRGFVEDLATSSALVSTAGNQLVGEALYLNKPVLAIPEDNNPEQSINATLLSKTEAGLAVSSQAFEATVLGQFLDDLDRYRARCRELFVAGNAKTFNVIRSFFPAEERLEEAAE
ncbi:MAG: glycosyltransferase family protein [Myxococcota bacterium]